MTKKVFRSLTLGVIVFAIAIMVGYLAYTVTYRYKTKRIQEELVAEDIVSAAAVDDTTETAVEEGTLVECYLARLENDDISIYMVTKDKVEFLYRLDIYTGNFPAEELLRLKEGIVLRDHQELASFEEDYTS